MYNGDTLLLVRKSPHGKNNYVHLTFHILLGSSDKKVPPKKESSESSNGRVNILIRLQSRSQSGYSQATNELA